MNINTDAVKVTLATAPSMLICDPVSTVATAICTYLEIKMFDFSNISQKRSSELFDDPEIVQLLISQMNKSENFASLVLDIWRRYNFESSEKRREILKSILNKASCGVNVEFDNFGKFFLIAQQITNLEIIVLKSFYLPDAHLYSGQPNSGNDYQLAVHELHRLFTDKNLNKSALPELENAMSQLSYYGLISEHPTTMGGPYYSPLRFGKIFLEYIKS